MHSDPVAVTNEEADDHSTRMKRKLSIKSKHSTPKSLCEVKANSLEGVVASNNNGKLTSTISPAAEGEPNIVEQSPCAKKEPTTGTLKAPKKMSFVESCPNFFNLLPVSDGEGEKGHVGTEPVIPHDECPDDMDPDKYAELIVRSMSGFAPSMKPALSMPEDFFPAPTPEQLSSYNNEILAVVRDNRLDDLRKIHAKGNVTLQCCNRFGESLIHMACRRGYTDMVRFLIQEAGVSIRVRDDCGRTPIHDACWNREPMLEIMDMLITEDPILLFVTDKRGHTPFQYARTEHWPVWRKFLLERKEKLCPDPSLVQTLFS